MGDIFAVDFTCENMTAAFIDEDGMARDEASFDLADFLAGDSGADKLVSLLAAKARMGGGSLDGVALTLPCDLDVKRERIASFPQATWLNGAALPAMLRDLVGAPVVMARRSEAQLAFDLAMLGLPEQSVIVGCYIGLLYEVSIWHYGEPVLGHNGRAGNITHLLVHDREDVCFCGKSGCVGLYGTGHRLRQMQTMIFPDTPMDELFVKHGDHPIVQDFIRMMAYPIGMAVNYSDPDYLVLGGSVVRMKAFPRALLEEEIRDAMYQPGDEGVRIVWSVVGDMVSVMVCGAQYARMKLAKTGEKEPQ